MPVDRRLLRQRILEMDDDGVAHLRAEVGTRQHPVVGPDGSGHARRDLDGRNPRFEVELEDPGIRVEILGLRQRQFLVPSVRLRDVLCGQWLRLRRQTEPLAPDQRVAVAQRGRSARQPGQRDGARTHLGMTNGSMAYCRRAPSRVCGGARLGSESAPERNIAARMAVLTLPGMCSSAASNHTCANLVGANPLQAVALLPWPSRRRHARGSDRMLTRRTFFLAVVAALVLGGTALVVSRRAGVRRAGRRRIAHAPRHVPFDRHRVGRDRRHALRRHRLERDGQDRQPARPGRRPRQGGTGAGAHRRRAGAEQPRQRRGAGARARKRRARRRASRSRRHRRIWPPPRRAPGTPTQQFARTRDLFGRGLVPESGVRDRAGGRGHGERAGVVGTRRRRSRDGRAGSPPAVASRRRGRSGLGADDVVSKTVDRLADRRRRQPPARARGRDGRGRHPESARHDAHDDLRPRARSTPR